MIWLYIILGVVLYLIIGRIVGNWLYVNNIFDEEESIIFTTIFLPIAILWAICIVIGDKISEWLNIY